MFGPVVTVVTANKPLNIANRIVRPENVTEDGLARDLLRKCEEIVPGYRYVWTMLEPTLSCNFFKSIVGTCDDTCEDQMSLNRLQNN